jgi:hypothetical protein
MRRAIAFGSLLTTLYVVAQMAACGNGADDVAACRQLENARCAQSGKLSCVDPSFPLHEGTSAADFVSACQLYYNDACLHGLVTPKAPNGNQLTNCTNAIERATTCGIVLEPQLFPECNWLVPPDAGVDAGHDAGAVVDTGTDQYTVVSEPDTGIDTGIQSCIATCDMTCSGDPNCITNCENTCNGM